MEGLFGKGERRGIQAMIKGTPGKVSQSLCVSMARFLVVLEIPTGGSSIDSQRSTFNITIGESNYPNGLIGFSSQSGTSVEQGSTISLFCTRSYGTFGLVSYVTVLILLLLLLLLCCCCYCYCFCCCCCCCCCYLLCRMQNLPFLAIDFPHHTTPGCNSM